MTLVTKAIKMSTAMYKRDLLPLKVRIINEVIKVNIYVF